MNHGSGVTHPHDRPDALSRRTALLLGSGLAVATLTGAPSRTAVAQEAGASVPFLGETYVGGTSDPYLLAAIVIGEAETGATSREARAYLCKTPVHMPGGIDEWLTGTLEGDTLDLVSEAGVRLAGQLLDEAVTGTVTLAEGESVALLATRAMGAAGLYSGPRVNRFLQAVSAEGGYFEELVAAAPDETYVLPAHWQIGHDRQPHPAAGIITPPDGPPVIITTYYDNIEDSDQLRVIVLNDGRHNGAGPDKDGKYSCRDIFI